MVRRGNALIPCLRAYRLAHTHTHTHVHAMQLDRAFASCFGGGMVASSNAEAI